MAEPQLLFPLYPVLAACHLALSGRSLLGAALQPGTNTSGCLFGLNNNLISRGSAGQREKHEGKYPANSRVRSSGGPPSTALGCLEGAVYQLELPQDSCGPHFPSQPGSLRCCPSHSFIPSSSAVLFSGHRQPEHGHYLASGFLGVSSAPRLGSRLLLPGGARLEIQLSAKQDKERDWPVFEMTCLSSSRPTLTPGRENLI